MQFMPSTTAGTAVARTAKTSTDSNQLTAIGESIAVTAAQLTLGAAFGNIRVPKGAEIAFVQLGATDLDSSTGITLSIGDASANARLMVANAIAQTGAVPVGPSIATAGFGYKYTDETLVQVYVAVAPTGTPAAGTIKYAVYYVSQ
jgi:hypothetical protein